MRGITAGLIPLLAGAGWGQERPPIIDMHLHASAAAENGPPPLALCVPVPQYPARDPAKSWGEIFLAWQKNPPCPDPVWSPRTDRALMEETIAVLRRRAEFYRYLQRIVEAGFGERVMFGSDQMVWPGVIERAIQAIDSAPFLSHAQKRDILYNNAARFLRLSEAEIAKHHGR